MAKTYINKVGGDSIKGSRDITVAAPFDVRSVVDTYDDLFKKDTFGGVGSIYKGMIVSTLDTEEVYMLVTLPGSRDNVDKYREKIKWKKIGSDLNTSEIGAMIVSSVDDLIIPMQNPHVGMIVVVKDDLETSEDEGGLYVLIDEDNTILSNWQKISSSDKTSSIEHVITTDGTIPSSSSGISINKNDLNSYIEEDYIDNNHEFFADKYYTSRGLNSSLSNGGELPDEESIILYADNSMNSFIELYAPSNDNWIRIKITDDSLGLNKSDITYLDGDGNVYQMVDDELVLSKETPISFGKDFSFLGLKENRGTSDEFEFGSTGSKYEDVDIYSTRVLPTIYAYSEGESVKILTEGDKTEILSIIEEKKPESITEDEIFGLFEQN